MTILKRKNDGKIVLKDVGSLLAGEVYQVRQYSGKSTTTVDSTYEYGLSVYTHMDYESKTFRGAEGLKEAEAYFESL